MTTVEGLRAALAALDEDQRHALTFSVAARRDQDTAEHEPRFGVVWAMFAALVAEVSDEQRATLRAMADDLSGATAQLVDDDWIAELDKRGPWTPVVDDHEE